MHRISTVLLLPILTISSLLAGMKITVHRAIDIGGRPRQQDVIGEKLFDDGKRVIVSLADGHGGDRKVGSSLQPGIPIKDMKNEKLADLGKMITKEGSSATTFDPGLAVAQYAVNQTLERISVKDPADNLGVFQEVFSQIENEVTAEPDLDSGGATLVTAYVDAGWQLCAIGWAGDSIAQIIDQDGKCVWDTGEEHRPCEDKEKKRIVQLNGVVTRQGSIKAPPHELWVSRAIGDADIKKQVKGLTHMPQTALLTLKPNDTIVLASDGVWEAVGKGNIAYLVASNRGNDIAKIIVAKARASSPHACDNLSCVTISLKGGKYIAGDLKTPRHFKQIDFADIKN